MRSAQRKRPAAGTGGAEFENQINLSNRDSIEALQSAQAFWLSRRYDIRPSVARIIASELLSGRAA
jgi:hypothetical protein